ncbi:MAG: ATP synthase F1 subunit epsilon [Bdellovibrionales bacterium]|nr:ATP synthase F1 subunit epsilon [Bdellovibrionales bacterium]
MGLTLTILTPQRKLIERENIQEIFVPGFKGELDILPNHANFVTEVMTGMVRWKTDAGWKKATVSTGLLEIFDQQVTVLADVAELQSEIDLKRAKNAEELAKQKLEQGGLDDDNFRKYQLKLQRATARISAAGES